MGFRYELACLGAGNMAEGIVAAVVAQGLYAPGAMIVSDPVSERRELFVRRFGTAATTDNRELVAQSRRILLAVKPQGFEEATAGVADLITADHLLISIMAGKSTSRIAAAFPGVRAKVVRVMPNLPIRVGAGVAGVFAGSAATVHDLTEVRAIFDAGGSSVVLDDESLMDAVTAVSGSGPAYFYWFVEAIVEGGKACGLKEADALELARFTCLGAARMMLETGEPPAELRARVTSKGGTTQAALDAMRQAGVDRAIRDAVIAACERSRELNG